MSHLSVEVAHIYLGDLTRAKAEATAHAAARASLPLIDAMTQARRTVSTCVLIDDYFEVSGGPSPDEARELVVQACADAGLTVHHVVMEGACADTVDRLMQRLRPEPAFGMGTQQEPPDKIGWLSNGARSGRQRPGVRMAGEQPPPDDELPAGPSAFGRRQHAIFLDVELWSRRDGTTLWSCPLLAAWWQLIRLGMLRNERGEPTMPARSWSAEDAPAFAARRTFSTLDPVFLEVEHAVRSILKQTEVPEEWYKPLREGPEPAGPLTHLDRIAYTFVSDSFYPPLRR